MLRILVLLIGAALIMLGFGIVQTWNGFLPEHPIYLFAAAGVLWIAALWRWRFAPALMSLGGVIITFGLVLFFVYPEVVNAGSGQDAVALFSGVGGFIAGLIGSAFLIAGLVIRAADSNSQRSAGA